MANICNQLSAMEHIFTKDWWIPIFLRRVQNEFSAKLSNGGRIEWVIRLRNWGAKFYHSSCHGFSTFCTTAILSIEYFFCLQRVIQQCIESILNRPLDTCAARYMKQYFPAVQYVISGAPYDGFLLNALKTLFSLPRVLFYL